MGQFRRALRQRRLVLTPWIILIAFAFYVSSEGNFASDTALEYLILLVVGLLFIFTLLLIKKYFFKKEHFITPEFKDQPEKFDQQTVHLRGQVVHILYDHAFEPIKRKIVDVTRSLTGNTDTTGRFMHQRFLVHCNLLGSNQNILVYHNVNFGRIRLKKGQTVEVKGIYIHQPPDHSRYGKIHYTHEPKGFVKVV